MARFKPRRKSILDFPVHELEQAIYVLSVSSAYLEDMTVKSFAEGGICGKAFLNNYEWASAVGVAKEFLEKIKEIQEG